MNSPFPSDVRLPSIDGLRAFQAAADMGSMERAAEALNISASAVSKRISTLEDLLGTALLSRTAKPLTLTAAGKEYLEQVREALSLLAAMPQHRRSAQRQERLRITVPPTFARQILVPALPTFNEAHPEVELELVLSIPFLDEGNAASDVEIRYGRDIKGQILMLDHVTPMAAPSLLARLPPILQAADLAHAPLLRTPLEPWSPWLNAAGLDWPEPSSGTRFVDLGLTLEAAICGQGIVLGRPSLAAHYLRSGALTRLFALQVPASQHYYLVTQGENPAGLHFEQWLLGHCHALSELLASPG